jgi:hypothetical protein
VHLLVDTCQIHIAHGMSRLFLTISGPNSTELNRGNQNSSNHEKNQLLFDHRPDMVPAGFLFL